MRLVYRDPVEELAALIEQARRNPRITHISITKSELRAILKHGSVSRVLPRFARARNNLMRTVNAKLDHIREELSKDDLDEKTREALFNQADEFEKQKLEIEDKVPSQIAEDGYLLKVSLK